MAIDLRGLAPLLEVFDMTVSVRFYCDVLGFELVQTSAPADYGWALLRRNGIDLMLNTAYEAGERPPAPDPARVAAHHDTALFFGCADLDGAYRHFREHGLDIPPPVVQSYGMNQLYVADPDGYNLCFQWPATEETREQWRVWYGG